MAIRSAGPFMILAIGTATAAAAAAVGKAETSVSAEATTSTESPDVAAAQADYERKERAVYDALVADPSPHTQILTSRIYLGDDSDPSNALRPKASDVLARAVEFAPDDAMVQWIAATEGSYAGSACAPTRWPDAEVANLIRLEPDNAAAWQFGVALAHAKGDEAGVDNALSRMAAANRAEDHVVDEIAAWTSFFAANRELADDFADEGDSLSPHEAATVAALSRVSYSRLPAEAALKAVCTPDPSSERTWQRLGWCVDAGRLLAGKGGSLALRKRGLVMLAAAGDRSDETSTAQRRYDWLEAHGVASMWESDTEDSGDAHAWVRNWEGASGEVDAIERRMKRLGVPLSPPGGWSKQITPEQAERATMAKLYGDYLASVFADMNASASPEERTFAMLNEHVVRFLRAAAEGSTSLTADAKPDPKAIAALAEANPGNVKVQWMIAASMNVPDEVRANAIATVQQAEGDNAAAWALSLEFTPASSELADTLLKRMAASSRYNTHIMDATSIALQALRRRPASPELLAAWAAQQPNVAAGIGLDDTAKTTALSMAAMTWTMQGHWVRPCMTSKDAPISPERRDACVTIGQLLVRNGTQLIDVLSGERVLTDLGALEGADAERVRHVNWWYQAMTDQPPQLAQWSAYMDTYLATGNEIEALRRAAERLGKSEPPANWKPSPGKSAK